MAQGLFVAFEGGDGAGKSTQARALAASLEARGLEVVLTREPGGTPAAEAIREVVLTPAYSGLDPRAEALLYAASRAEHVASLVLPALQRGAVVITDRYIDSSIAYQGVGRGLGPDVVGEINLWATRSLLPDLTVLLDVDAGAGLARISSEPDRLESEPEEFHATVVTAFRALAAGDPERYLVLPAHDDVGTIAASVLARVDELVAAR
ncbi:MAG TPA: dTMP kinase [Candidatus Nanopelagicales bacterium]|nr:dTMP kinase [Candidatus Nanopelagicales bacterium]